ncbi:MAG: hypothetical protein R3D32_13315 [Nitratireductor sp.]
MSNAARSVAFQAILVLGAGLAFLFGGKPVLGMLGLSGGPFVPVLAIILLGLAWLYGQVAVHGDLRAIRATIGTRVIVAVGLALLVLNGQGEAALLAFAALDLATAFWTWRALRNPN